MSKNIQIRDDIYDKLKDMRKPIERGGMIIMKDEKPVRESFSDVLDKIFNDIKEKDDKIRHLEDIRDKDGIIREMGKQLAKNADTVMLAQEILGGKEKSV